MWNEGGKGEKGKRERGAGDPQLVSVVLPCFNAADTLSAAIASIRDQTYEDWELIVLDDGSTDDSRRIAEDFAELDSRIRIVASPHVGIVAALQQACAQARGPFIARMDADDVAHPARFERQVALMTSDPRLALCGTRVNMRGPNIGYGRHRYETWINGLVTHEEIVRELFVECPIPHPTFMLRRESFDRAGGYEDHGWPEDYDLCMRMFLAGMRFGKVEQALLDWTESPKRLSMVDPRYAPESFRALKRHYLFQSYLRGHDSFYQWGAGEVGKRWLREWGVGRRPLAVVDINPRKIGHAIHGIPVIAPEALPGPGAAYLIIAVGARTARQEIRARLEPRGYRELEDFLFLA